MVMSNKNYDVIVIGGGPSGMMAAGRTAERGFRVLLLEKNKNLGKKLSLTGGGRCNILNAEENEKELIEKYGKSKKFLHSTFSQFGMKDTCNFFEEKGLPLVTEARKRVFPKSQKSLDVIKTMEEYMAENGVEVKRGLNVKGFEIKKCHIVGVKTDFGLYYANKFILSTGGLSYPKTGSTGEGLKWLRDIGHTINSPEPSLVPLTVKESWVKELSGVTLSFAKITFGINKTKKEGKFSKTGKILFTHFGLSGPLILNASREVKELLKKGLVKTEIDMYPDTDINEIRKNLLNLFNRNKNKSLKNIIKEVTPEGMSENVVKLVSSSLLETKVHNISKEKRENIADIMKRMPLTVTGTMGMDRAIASNGGLDLSEVDTKTMSSKIYKNLYITGDIIDIERPSGGFSLQWCWTSGWVAGSNT